MQTRFSDENSVCLSNACIVSCDKTEERSVQSFIPYERSFSLVLRITLFYLKFWVNLPRWSEIADFDLLFARSASAVTPSEKSSNNTNRKSTARFPMSLRWSSYVSPEPQSGSKTQNGRFRYKITLPFVFTKFLCVKTVSDTSRAPQLLRNIMHTSLSRIWAFDLYQNRTRCAVRGSGASCYLV